MFQRMHHRKSSRRQAMRLSKTFRSRSTSRYKAALNDSAKPLSTLIPTAPMDWRTPSDEQEFLMSCEVYTLPSLGYRTPVEMDSVFWKQNPPQANTEIKANA